MTELPVEAPLEEEKPAEEQRATAGYWTIEDTERLFIVIHSEAREKPWTVIAEKLGRSAEDCEKWYKYILTAHSQLPEEDRRTYSGTPTNSKKRSRRKASSVDRPFVCQVVHCRRAYGTEGALKFHMTHKHPDVKYIPSYLTPYNPTYKSTYTLFNGQQDGSMITTGHVMDQSGNSEHDHQMGEHAMAFEIHHAALEQLQAQQGELAQDGEAVQEQMIDHGEPQTPNEEIPESVGESMQDQTQNTVDGEQSVSQAEQPDEQPEQEGEQVEQGEQGEQVEQENTEGVEGEADQTQ